MKNFNLGFLILRLSIGILMLFHGIAKIKYGISFIEESLVAKNLPEILAYGVFIGEIIAPLLLIVGYRTRLAGIIFVLNCIAILYLGNYNLQGLTPYGGWAAELPGLFLFGGLTLIFTGGGKYAMSSRNNWD